MVEIRTITALYRECRNRELLVNGECGISALNEALKKSGVRVHKLEYHILDPGYTAIAIIGTSHSSLSTWPEILEATLTIEAYRGARHLSAVNLLKNLLEASEYEMGEIRLYNTGISTLKRKVKTPNI